AIVRADSEFVGWSLTVRPFHLRPTHTALLAALGTALCAAPVYAQDDIAADSIPSPQLEGAAETAQDDLNAVRGEIDLSHERIEAIRAEIEALDGDATRLGAELAAAAQRVDLADDDIRLVEERLEALFAAERTIRLRLD